MYYDRSGTEPQLHCDTKFSVLLKTRQIKEREIVLNIKTTYTKLSLNWRFDYSESHDILTNLHSTVC